MIGSPARRYEDLNQYEIIKTTVNNYPANKVMEARDRQTGHVWFLALRHDEYSAQIDKATSEIYRMFIWDSPAMHIVQNNDDYYIASQKIENLTDAFDFVNTASPDFKPRHFGSINVLSHFVGESDLNSDNVLMKMHKRNILTAHKIDNPESLDAENLQSAVLKDGSDSDEEEEAHSRNATNFTSDDVFATHWRFIPAVVNHFQYINEQQKTFATICETPFVNIANCIRNNVTASNKAGRLLFMKKIIEHNSIQDPESIAEIQDTLKNPDKLILPEIEETIALLEKRHQRYKALYRK